MLPKHEPSSKFGKWLLKHRLLIVIFSFVVIVPIAFVVALYLGDYLKYQTVDFGNDPVSSFNTNYYITTEETTGHQIINFETPELTYHIKWVSYLVPEFKEDPGNYVFKVKYTEKPSKLVSSVNGTFVLQTLWIDAKSAPKSIVASESFGTNQTINYEFKLPQSPLWFVTVERPYVYIKLTYNSEIGMNQSEVKTHYLKIDLAGLTPSAVIDAQE